MGGKTSPPAFQIRVFVVLYHLNTMKMGFKSKMCLVFQGAAPVTEK